MTNSVLFVIVRAEKTEAQYKVAQEKCDAFSGPTKDECLSKAKVSAGK